MNYHLSDPLCVLLPLLFFSFLTSNFPSCSYTDFHSPPWYSFTLYLYRSGVLQNTRNPDVMTKLGITLAYWWEVNISGISQEFHNTAENSRSCSFSALHDSWIWIKSIPKEIYITSLLGQNILLQSESAYVSSINTLLIYYINELMEFEMYICHRYARCAYILFTSTIISETYLSAPLTLLQKLLTEQT